MRNIWKLLLVAIAGLALAAAAVGIVAAQTDDATPTPSATDEPADTPTEEAAETPADEGDDASTEDESGDAGDDKATRRDELLDTLAENLGISREELDAALRQTGLDLVDQALADGRLTEEEAAAIRERIESGEFPPFFGGPGFHHRGPGPGFCPGASLEQIAEFLGVERDVIVEGLENDQSLAEIAEANGSSRDALIAFIMGEIEQRVNDAVENERITQEEADQILANAEERVNELVDREGLPGPRGRFGPGRFFDGNGTESETETSGLLF